MLSFTNSSTMPESSKEFFSFRVAAGQYLQFNVPDPLGFFVASGVAVTCGGKVVSGCAVASGITGT